jgi:hypothetical protein
MSPSKRGRDFFGGIRYKISQYLKEKKIKIKRFRTFGEFN